MSKYKITHLVSGDSIGSYKQGIQSSTVPKKIFDVNEHIREKNTALTKSFKWKRSYRFSELPSVPETGQIQLESFRRHNTEHGGEDEFNADIKSVEKYVYLGYEEGNESAREIRNRLESEGLNVKDFEHDGIFGKPEKRQIAELMENSTWILLYLSDVDCDSFWHEQEMAIDTAEGQHLEKVICLVSSSCVKVPRQLNLFPCVTIEEDWMYKLKTIVTNEPNQFQRDKCALKKCPLSKSLLSVQSDNVDVAKRLHDLDKPGLSSSSMNFISQKDRWESIQK